MNKKIRLNNRLSTPAPAPYTYNYPTLTIDICTLKGKGWRKVCHGNANQMSGSNHIDFGKSRLWNKVS